jgi:Domain of unknown function (DUF4352)
MSQQPPSGPPEGWRPPGGQQPPPPEGQPGGQGQGWGQQPPGSPYGQPTGQQPAGWGPGPATGTQPPKKSRGRTFAIGCLGLVGVLVLLGIVAALAGGGDDPGTAVDQASPTTAGTRGTTATTRATTKTTATPAPEAPKIGTPVRDGKFEFVVRKVDCGKTRIGDQYVNTKAQGQFCLVHLKVTNIGKEAQTLDGSNQYLFGSGGQRFDADTEAAIYLDEAQTFLEQINPGNTVNGIVVFDIPKSEKPTKIELHDSAFSGGVTVEL